MIGDRLPLIGDQLPLIGDRLPLIGDPDNYLNPTALLTPAEILWIMI
jgi:hypothetical protein